MLSVSKNQLDGTNVACRLVPCDETGCIIVEAVWCIGAHLIINIFVKNQANIEISLKTSIMSLSNSQHNKIDRSLNEKRFKLLSEM